jgi:hypothetical protein
LERFSSRLMSEIAFETYWPTYRDALFRINAMRYNGLGEVRSKEFAKKAYAAALGFGIGTVGGVCWYLIPCGWLGLHFASDPRYAEIARRLAGNACDGDEDVRIERARHVFCKIAEQTTGLKGEKVPAALQRSQAHAAWLADARTSPEAAIDFLLDAWDVGPDARRSFPKAEFIACSQREVERAGLRGGAALKTHVAIAFFLGTGFLHDPQFGWAADAVQQAKDMGQDPVAFLAHYGRGRLDSLIEQRAGVT